MYRSVLRPLLFALPPNVSHDLGQMALAPLEHVGPLRVAVHAACAPKNPRLVTHAMGLTFPSPIGVAGGFDKNALLPRALAALGFGFLELGTVTALAQEPNPRPHLFRLPEDRALINRLGFPNDGAAAVASRLRQTLAGTSLGIPVGISIGKSRAVPIDPIEGAVEDYLTSFRHLRGLADFFVINISSPNTRDLRALQASQMATPLLAALVQENRNGGAKEVPLLVKVSPDLSDEALESLLAVVRDEGLDGVVATNTTVQRAGLRTDAAWVESLGAGGLSGPPLRLRALEVVRRARAVLGPSATIIGVGGIETGDHVHRFLKAGANLVQVYTAFVYGGPLTPVRLSRELLEAQARANGSRERSES